MGESMISFFVPGVPVAKGSTKAFYNKKTGKTMTIQNNLKKQKPWSSLISYTVQQNVTITDKPVELHLQFFMPRPKAHYRTGKNSHILKDSAPVKHTNKPDLDKLIRCVLDALTGILYKDDSQVYGLVAEKTYSDKPGVQIDIIEGDK